MDLYRGFVECKEKQSIHKIKNAPLNTFEEVEGKTSFAGVLREGIIMVDIDDTYQSEALYNVIKDMGVKTPVLKTTRGLHFYFTEPKSGYKAGCSTHVESLIGVTMDIKVGPNCYDALKVNGVRREWIIECDELQEMPCWLYLGKLHMFGMKDGDGRNDALFKLIPTLQKYKMTPDEIRKLYACINKHIFQDPLSNRDIETITRDESFVEIKEGAKKAGKPSYKAIAEGFIQENNLRMIDGVFYTDEGALDKKSLCVAMLNYEETLTIKGRQEVESILEAICPTGYLAPVEYIKFKNGIYDTQTGLLLDDMDDISFPNVIDWNYDPETYDPIMDETLNKICCHDDNIRLIIEEMIGYCFYRDCFLRKAFILYGGKRNGKSSFLRSLIKVLGDRNITTIDMRDLSRQFSTIGLRGKIANIGDDISSNYIDDTSLLKKVVSGEWMTVDRKYKDAITFRNYAKLVFSANDLGAFKDESGAMLDRLIVIPFDAYFSPDDADFNPLIERDMTTDKAMEYLVRIGIEGLNRLIKNNAFTDCEKSNEIKKTYGWINNPINEFFQVEMGAFLGFSTQEIYDRYRNFCVRNGNNNPYSKTKFVQLVNNFFGTKTDVRYINEKGVRVFIKR